MTDLHEKLLEVFISTHSLEAAQLAEILPDAELSSLLESVHDFLAAKLLGNLSRFKAARCLKILPPGVAAMLIEKNDFKSAELMLRQLDQPALSVILGEMSVDRARRMRQKLGFKENCVGALMDLAVLTFQENNSIVRAIETAKGFQNLASPYGYVIRADKSLAGIVKLHDLITTEHERSLESIMITKVPKIPSELEFESIVDHPGWLDFYELPVVDRSDAFLGVIKIELILRTEGKSLQKQDQQALKATFALGELYRVGLTGLLRAAGD